MEKLANLMQASKTAAINLSGEKWLAHVRVTRIEAVCFYLSAPNTHSSCTYAKLIFFLLIYLLFKNCLCQVLFQLTLHFST